MLKNYFKITLRNLHRQKIYSFINIAGLAIGMACAILILLWVQDELSYDRFHHNADRIYRIVAEWKEPALKSARTPGKLAPTIKAEIPEVVYIARVMPATKSAFRYAEKAFYEEAIAYVDPAFFEMFSFDLLEGDKSNVLENTGTIVITENMALKYFESNNPAGEFINWNNWADFAITGVLQNIPANSHIQYDFFRSHAGVKRAWPGGYTWQNFIHETYVLLQENADTEAVAKKITSLYFRNAPYMAPYVRKFSLQPLTDIYLNTEIEGSRAFLGDIRYVYIFSIVAVFVLLIACI
ncbi:MAG: ABC transporter permease, partial [bacterium]